MEKVKLTKGDITKKLLEDVAKEFNRKDVMNLEPPIPTGRKVTKEALQKDVVEAAGELILTDIPKLAPKTIEVLEALEVKMPVEEGKEGVQTSSEEEPDTDKAGKAAEKGPKTPQDEPEGESKGQGEGGQGEAGKDKVEIETGGGKATRLDCYCQAIKELCGKGATKKQIIDRSDEIYRENGGKAAFKATNIAAFSLGTLFKFSVLSDEKGIIRFIK